MAKEVVTLTETARTKMLDAINKRGSKTLGIYIGVNTKGCSGHSYVFEFCESEDPLNEKISLDDSKNLYIDPKGLLFLIGTEIDWQEDKFKGGFVFNNPNAKGMCGCGESFHV